MVDVCYIIDTVIDIISYLYYVYYVILYNINIIVY